ncbi:MAG: VanZ family protein, partial [Dehalococcoidia bacterium]
MTASSLRRAGQALTALSALLIAYATLAPDAASPVGADDRLLHFLLFLPLGAGGALWVSERSPAAQAVARAVILLGIVAFAAATELAQGPIETRSPSWPDFFADAAGAATGVLAGSI